MDGTFVPGRHERFPRLVHFRVTPCAPGPPSFGSAATTNVDDIQRQRHLLPERGTDETDPAAKSHRASAGGRHEPLALVLRDPYVIQLHRIAPRSGGPSPGPPLRSVRVTRDTFVVEAAHPVLEATWRRPSAHVDGAYADFLTSATEEDVAAIYPTQTYNRLAAIKRQYDSGNLFAQNHNVRPQHALADTHDGGRRIPQHRRRLHKVPAAAVGSRRSAVS